MTGRISVVVYRGAITLELAHWAHKKDATLTLDEARAVVAKMSDAIAQMKAPASSDGLEDLL